MPPLENWEKGLASGPESFKWDGVNSLLVLQTVRNSIHHVSLLPQACGGSHWDHQEGDSWRWLRGQICGQKVSLFAFLCCLVRCSKKQYRDIHLCIVWFDNAFNVCISVDHLHVRLFIGVTGHSMANTVERQSTCFRRWSRPIRKPSSLTWRVLTV